MKKRTGFVSNSSSQSFALKKVCLNEFQLTVFKDYKMFANMMNQLAGKELYEYVDSPWEVTETEDKIEFNTWMNNFDMEQLALDIGVPEVAFIDREGEGEF